MIYTPLDRVERMEPGQTASAIKVTTRADTGYCQHRVTTAVTTGYPWTLALEGAFQCAAVLLKPVLEDDEHTILLRVDRAEFEGPLPYGERLLYALRVLRRNEKMARVECDISIEETIVGRATFTMGVIAAASSVYGDAFERHQDVLTRRWHRVAETSQRLAGEAA